MGWYEGPVDPFVATLLVDLRDAVWALKHERVELKSAIVDVVVKMEQMKKEIAALKEANEALNAGNLARSECWQLGEVTEGNDEQAVGCWIWCYYCFLVLRLGL